jgi:SAM-dependent methyltransferase
MVTFVPNVCCVNTGGAILALRDQLFAALSHDRVLSRGLSVVELALLELFAHHHDPSSVFERLKGVRYSSAASDLDERLSRQVKWLELRHAPAIRLFMGKSRVVALPFDPDRSDGGLDLTEAIDLTRISRSDPRVSVALLAEKTNRSRDASPGAIEYETFMRLVTQLSTDGLLAPEPGSVDWGDLKRRDPLCQGFGYLRGTPVDRYYLLDFVRQIRRDVRGRVLEIGGKLTHKDVYSFADATEYRTLDLPGTADDLVGDASDPTVVEKASFDAVLAFNVLEHCERPDLVVDNMWRWLKPGGRAFAAVPTAQKIHAFPKDYWRPLPDALKAMFGKFTDCRLEVYGSLVTVVANLYGLAAEELNREELDQVHPDYPVLACVAARR